MNCKEAIRLMSQEMDRNLSGSERLSLRLHVLICIGCHRYRQQMAFLRQACRRDPPPDDASTPPGTE